MPCGWHVNVSVHLLLRAQNKQIARVTIAKSTEVTIFRRRNIAIDCEIGSRRPSKPACHGKCLCPNLSDTLPKIVRGSMHGRNSRVPTDREFSNSTAVAFAAKSLGVVRLWFFNDDHAVLQRSSRRRIGHLQHCSQLDLWQHTQ